MKVVGFGDLLLRLQPQGYERIAQAETFRIVYTGAEANTMVCLRNLGIETEFLSKVPDSAVGQSAINYVRKFGVETKRIAVGGERLGLFYYEKGASQRPSNVIYDRNNSSIATAKAEDFNWKDIFKDCGIFYVTGITPALSDNLANITLEACKTAKKMGITVVCDLNYRSKLWGFDKAGKVMNGILPYVDYCSGIGVYEAKNLFNITTDKQGLEAVKEIADKLIKRYNVKGYISTLRKSLSSSDEELSGIYYDGAMYQGKTYSMHIVDRLGGGDSFIAGFIYGLIKGFEPQKAIDFAVATACLKHSVEGDYDIISVKEVEALVNGNESGRVQR